MNRLLMVLALLVFSCPPLPADDLKTQTLQKEIAALKAQLAAKEAELDKLVSYEAVPFLFADALKVGTSGPVGSRLRQRGVDLGKPGRVETFSVVKVIDAQRALVRAQTSTDTTYGTSTFGNFILVHTTKGVKDGGGVKPDCQSYRVTGTEKYNGRMYYTVEPMAPPK